ncbi:P-loop containing nucleoside triphosphate hydrolase protein [Suillus occidentalis]|nr:P-loop containing nucleoside triphosphate hydrolase protein [Suillus occidentalis]
MGRNATFKSIEQARASEAVSARLKDLIIVLGTGEGKTLLYMMPAVSVAEKNLASVVIVPLKALLDELRARFEDKGLLTLTWSPGIKTYNARTIFVSVEQLECPSFFDYLREGVQKGALSRVVIDESHYALTSKHYRPCLLLMPHLRQLALQIVACTATLPPATIPRFLHHFQMLSGATEIIREQSYLTWLAGLLQNLPAADKILVFCQTKATAQAMAKASCTKFYHSELPDEEKKKTLDGFKVGVGALRVLYTTSALSAGLDIRDIRAVVHLREPSNMLDYGQEFGRGCRDGKPGWSFVFHDPKQKPFNLQAGQDDTGVSEMASWLSAPTCRRLGLSLFFDGRSSSCLEMVTVQLCDICQMTVAKVLLMLS